MKRTFSTQSTTRVAWLLAVFFAGASMAQAAPWQDLFDGKTLNGWVQRGGNARYTVEDGMIVGATVPRTPNSFLCTAGEYGDFVLEVDFLVDDGLNSGIQIRSNSFPGYKNGRVHGYQVEIDPSKRAWSAGIYDEGRRGWLANLKNNEPARKAFKNGKWNHYRIEAVGDSIKTWINGVPAADLKDSLTPRGFIALQVHASGTPGLKIRWKNVRIQVLDKPRPSLKVLIVDGQNNHNWKGTTPVLKAILEDAGIFTADVATTPSNMAEFRPDFSRYDVIVSNYNGADWPQATQDAFTEFVRSGGGLVVVHAADNSFPKWKEFNEMIGLGGWGGRNEKSGPMLYWENGKVVRDTSPGAGGTHGPQHPYPITIRDPKHPITAGLPPVWMHAKDELYSKLRGPARNLHILATAYADRAKGGTGRHEPALFTIRYGKGRIFHTTLGHGVQQMQCTGFAFTLQRGTEWAATGKVTLTKVPDDFPTADRVRTRLPGTAYESIKTWEFGTSRKLLAAIEESARGASRPYLEAMESKLVAALNAPETKYAGKQFVLRMLRRIGSCRCVPAVARLLLDPKLSHLARFTLQRLPCPGATRALLDALKEADGAIRIGIIGSLADRKGPAIAAAIAPFAASSDTPLARSAIRALGRLGGEASVEALQDAKVADSLRGQRDRALLACADGLPAEKGARAVAVYRRLAGDGQADSLVRLGASRGLLRLRRAATLPAIVGLLAGDDPVLRPGAVKLLIAAPGPAVTRLMAGHLGDMPPHQQVAVLGILAARADPTAAPNVMQAAKSPDGSVRIAALGTLGALRCSQAVPLLARRAVLQSEEGRVAFDSLTALGGKGTNEVLARQVKEDEPAVRAKAIEALQARHATESLPVILAAARDQDAAIRSAAYKALGALAGPEKLGDVAALLVETSSGPEREQLTAALRTIAARILDKEQATAGILAALRKADDDAKGPLLQVLAVLSTEDGLAAVRRHVRSKSGAVALAAVEALGTWGSTAPLDDLLSLAETPATPALRSAALRGVVRLLSQPGGLPSTGAVERIARALRLCKDAGDRKGLLEILPRHPCKEALDLATSWKQDKEVGETAEKAAAAIRGILLSGSMVATASHNSGETKRAMDGDQNTRWSTNTPMRPGMWFMIDLGAERTVRKIMLDTRNSPGDYPRGCEVFASLDGKTWGKPVLKSPPQRPITRLVFPSPVRARFVKIVQTGSTQGLFWSIHNMRIDVE